MNQSLVIGVVVIAVVGAGLYLSRRSGSGGAAEQGPGTLFAKPLTPALFDDEPNPPALVNTGFSTGSSQFLTPDAEPTRAREPTRERLRLWTTDLR